MSIRITHCFISFALALLLNSCANVVTPSGGPKDTVPPKVVSSEPENFSKNFTSSVLTFEFDEYITLNNAAQNVTFSPPLAQTPSYTVKGKKLIIKMKEKPAAGVTYSVSLNNAVKDLHEGNVVKDFTFVFSTGELIDTLSICGCVLDAMTRKPVDNVWAMLYDVKGRNADSLPYIAKPDYLVKTGKDGKFTFSGLKDNDYFVFALDDMNSNRLYDLVSERIAFADNLVSPVYAGKGASKADEDTLKTNVVDALNLELLMFAVDDTTQQLLRAEAIKKGQFRFAFRRPVADSDIRMVGDYAERAMKVFSANRDTVSFYFDPAADSISVVMRVDTVSETKTYPVKVRGKRRPVTEFAVRANISNERLGTENPFELLFDEPVVRVGNSDSLLFVAGSDSSYNSVTFSREDEYGFRYKLNRDISFDTLYSVVVPDSMFFSYLGKTNKKTSFKFKRSDYSDFGSVFVKVVMPEGLTQAVFYLVTEAGKKVAEQTLTSNGEVSFLDIAPGKYHLKALLDTDGNGVWSPGRFDLKRQSEVIVAHPQLFDVKANWDIDLEEVWTL